MRSLRAGIVMVALLMAARAAWAGGTLYERLAAGETGEGIVRELQEALKKSAPVIEGEHVTFALEAAGFPKVSVAGDWTGWQPRPMAKLGSSSLYWRTERFEPASRLEYKFIRNENDWTLDPANSRSVDNGIGGENSLLRMPGYKPFLVHPLTDKEKGRDETLEIKSAVLGMTRYVGIHLPAGYDTSSARYPVVYLHDGPEYRIRGRAGEITDMLAADGKMRPVILAFVPPGDRNDDYWHNAGPFIRFMSTELVPAVDAKYRTVASPAARATGGASLGGLISVRLAQTRPELFGLALSQSGAFQVEGGGVLPSPPKPARLWMAWGSYETPLPELSPKLAASLKSAGWTVEAKQYPTGHNWAAWRDHLAEALEWLFPPAR